jgi:hypothetical protein
MLTALQMPPPRDAELFTFEAGCEDSCECEVDGEGRESSCCTNC